jgi:predicted protein tyrosine phosphatase
MKNMKMDELKPGDVLLSYGNGKISDLVKQVGGGDYSHAAFFDGKRIIEAGSDGVISSTIEEDIKQQKYIDVYRFKSASDNTCEDPDWSLDPVIKQAHMYLNNKTYYADNQLYLLVVLITLRRKYLKNLADAIAFYVLLDEVFDLLKSKSDGKTKSVVCSEFVYRCFDEAEPNKYGLTINIISKEKEEVPALEKSISTVVNLPETQILLEKYAEDPKFKDIVKLLKILVSMEKNNSKKVIQKATNEIIPKATNEIIKKATNEITQNTQKMIEEIRKLAAKKYGNIDDSQSDQFVVAEMVTPYDLQKSPSLEKIGRLEK